jgi:hypothetical protein
MSSLRRRAGAARARRRRGRGWRVAARARRQRHQRQLPGRRQPARAVPGAPGAPGPRRPDPDLPVAADPPALCGSAAASACGGCGRSRGAARCTASGAAATRSGRRARDRRAPPVCSRPSRRCVRSWAARARPPASGACSATPAAACSGAARLCLARAVLLQRQRERAPLCAGLHAATATYMRKLLQHPQGHYARLRHLGGARGLGRRHTAWPALRYCLWPGLASRPSVC